MHRTYKNEWSLLVGAVLLTITSFILDIYFCGFNWFARSGALMVLLAAIVEFRISGHIYDDIQRSQLTSSIVNSSIPLKAKPTKKRKKIAITAHTLLVVGTIIWGYGDLIWSKT